jgi:hypothetical protein
MESVMKREYDIFEKFSDGSSLWRDSILGLENTRFRIRELAARSANEFYAINLVLGRTVSAGLRADPRKFNSPMKAPRNRANKNAA